MKRSTLKAAKFLECPLCNESKADNHFMVLSKCKHTFCKSCLQRYSTHHGAADARCPYQACDKLLNDAERQDILHPAKPASKGWKFWKSKEKSTATPVIDAKRRNSAEIYTGMWVKLDQSNENQFDSKSEEEFLSLTVKEDFPKLSDTVPKAANQQNNTKKSSTDGLHDELNLNPVKNAPIPKPSKYSQQFKVWDAESRINLLQHIKDKLHKVVDFMFLAIEADILLNSQQEDCLTCCAIINEFEGISFPYCSHTFCRICLTKPNGTDLIKCAEDIIVLYSNNSIKNKNCAIILDADIRDLLFDPNRFAQFQQKIAQKIPNAVTEYDNFVVQNSGNTNILDFENTFKEPNAGNVSLISFDTSPEEAIVKPILTRESLTDVVLLRNTSPTACLRCNRSIPVRKGVILRECYHVLCDRCLVDTIMKTLDSGVEVRCPMKLEDKRWCRTIIQEREIKSLLSEEQYEKYERRCLEIAQGQFESSARCFKPNCTGWIVFEGYKDSFLCPVCGNQNCLSCKAIHHGKSCNGYKMEKERSFAKNSKNVIRCPECKGTNTKDPVNNFIRCLDCTFVFNLRKQESKKWFSK